MTTTNRTITAAARDLQAAANRLELMNRNRNRDTILAVLFADVTKGQRAQQRLEAEAPQVAALEEQIRALRAELGTMLDGILPESEETEPPKRKRKKS